MLTFGGSWSLDPLYSSLRIRKRNNLKGKLKIKGKADLFRGPGDLPPPRIGAKDRYRHLHPNCATQT